jgi:hypothetical protein
MDQPARLPNFFIVGAPKAGTTSLHAYLAQHPRIYLSPLKETYYFSSEFRLENFSDEVRPRLLSDARALEEYLQGEVRELRFGGLVSRWEDYLKLFRHVSDEIAIGEATPLYLWSQSAPGNIAALIPHARIVISLRNPVDRAYSHYLHMVASGAVRRSFREQIEASLRVADQRKIGPAWPFLEFGRYHEQISRYLSVFPRSQLHISLFEELQETPDLLITRLFTFLGVDPTCRVDLTRRHNEPSVHKLAAATYFLKKWRVWEPLRRLAPASTRSRLRSLLRRPAASLAMPPADRALLVDYYRDEVLKLSALINRDLSGWLSRAADAGARSGT